MAPPVNTDWTTATEITSLPASLQQDVYDAGTTYDVWYKYTAQAGDVLVSLFAYGYFIIITDYQPETRVYTVPVSTPVSYLDLVTTQRPIQFPVTPGTTYYFKFSCLSGNPTPALLKIEATSLVNLTLQRGSIVVNDDTDGFPLLVLSSGDDYTVRSALDSFPAGEAGDILPNGVSLWSDANNLNLHLYDASFTLITTIAFNVGYTISIRGNRGNNLFYVARFAGSWTWTVKAYDDTGTEVDSWSLLLTGQGLDGLAASNDGTILYHSQMDAGTPLRRWDLVNDVALSNLAAADGTYGVSDILVLDDNSIVAAYFNYVSLDFKVKRYDPSGTLLNTYEFGEISYPAFTPPRLAYAADFSPRSFWVWFHLTDTQAGTAVDISRFQHILVSDGSIIASVDSAEFEGGIYQGTPTANPGAFFGNSFSCPFIVFTQGSEGEDYVIVVPPGALVLATYPPILVTVETVTLTPTPLPIRRLRRSQHLSTDGLLAFYSRFQLDLEAGVGLTTGQGEDPQLMLRWSDDGGHTWSNDHWVSAGKIGEYLRRAVWRRLGRSRDRVFEVTISDPVKVAWIDAWIDVGPGTH